MQSRSLGLFISLIIYNNHTFAATSAINNNFRIFEDTIWLFVFSLMIVAGLKLRKLSTGGATAAYWFMVFTGISGWCWKGIGLVKRVFIINDPEWLYSVTRETFEGFTGILLATSFLILVISIRNISRR